LFIVTSFRFYLSSQSGISYEGQFERGLRNGRGKIRYADGSWYIGAFENGIVCKLYLFIYFFLTTIIFF
jgi:hypothetical protein